MKKLMSMLVAGAVIAGTACTSTNTGSGTGSDTMSGSTGGASGTSTSRATGTTTGGGSTSTSSGSMTGGSTSTGTTGSGSTGGMTTTGSTGTGSTGGMTTGTGTTTTGSTTGGMTTGTTTGTTGSTTGTTTGGTTIGATGGAATGTTGGGTTGGGTTGTAAGAGATGGGAGATMDMTNMTDAMFLMTAASSNLFEIQAGKLAAQSAGHAEVKKFGQMMVDHHTKASQEQMPLATQMKVTLPKTLMPVHQEMLDRLKGKTGKAFDEDYMDIMETAHKMDIAMFTMKSTRAETPTVKAFATKGLPMLKAHQAQATKLEDTVD